MLLDRMPGPGLVRCPGRVLVTLTPFLTLLALAVPAAAQTVRGTVLAAGTGEPVPGARLLLRDDDGEVQAASISGDTGEFVLRTASASLVRIEVSHLGYADWSTANFALASNTVIDIEVRLGIEAIPLDPIVVLARATSGPDRLAGFEERRRDPGGFGGYYLTEEDIASRAAATPTSLVLGTPGVSLGRAGSGMMDRNVILTGGGCVARTFIDGISVEQSAEHTIDDLLSPDLIAGIEVYPRGMTVPPQYQNSIGGDCGAVLFWTKAGRPSQGSSWGLGRIAIGLGLLAGIVTLGFSG